MAKVVIELSAPEHEKLQKLAESQKRTPKAQAEWILFETLTELQVALNFPETNREAAPCV